MANVLYFLNMFCTSTCSVMKGKNLRPGDYELPDNIWASLSTKRHGIFLSFNLLRSFLPFSVGGREMVNPYCYRDC